MRRKFTSLLLALVLCLGLTVSASAAEQKITVGEETYDALLGAIMSETKADAVTARLDSDVTLTAAVVIGSSDYNGLFEQAQTVTAKNVTIDLNGYTLTGAKDCAIFEVQAGYTLTIVDNSEAKTGKLVTQGKEEVTVAEGATYNALPAAEEETTEESEEETPANPFTDVVETSPYYDAILWAVEKGITQGYEDGTFQPATTCSHMHILTFLWRAEGGPVTGDEAFQSEKGTSLYITRWAVAEDLLQSGTDIHSGCTRADAVTYLWKAAGSPEAKETVSFTDVASDAEYAQAVAWAVENGVTLGTSDTTFSPDTICTRGQIATFLYRAENIPAGEAETTPAA